MVVVDLLGIDIVVVRTFLIDRTYEPAPLLLVMGTVLLVAYAANVVTLIELEELRTGTESIPSIERHIVRELYSVVHSVMGDTELVHTSVCSGSASFTFLATVFHDYEDVLAAVFVLNLEVGEVIAFYGVST